MRRLVDIVAAGIAGIILSPLVVLIGLAVWLKMGRPIFFYQVRIGLNGRAFRMVKFRSMTDARDPSGQLLEDDARLPPFGRALRRTRLDELPELWNVFVGEMSLIGPRPLLVESLTGMGAAARKRGSMRPGLTGWAQVNGNALLEEPDKLALDLWYIDHASLRLDLIILARTVAVIVAGERINRLELRRAYAGNHRRRG
jgi:lipopolysaccharide/colanic/teichoic acid biosynthesis glycosyltransferase